MTSSNLHDLKNYLFDEFKDSSKHAGFILFLVYAKCNDLFKNYNLSINSYLDVRVKWKFHQDNF